MNIKSTLFTTSKNKQIYTYEDVFDLHETFTFYEFARFSLYNTCGSDTGFATSSQNNQCYSSLTADDLKKSGFLNSSSFKYLDTIHNFYNRDVAAMRINCSNCFEQNVAHVDVQEGITLLYYFNLEWDIFHGGHTLFYNEALTSIEYTSVYKPNKVIVFDGCIPHSVSSISIGCNQHRYSLALQCGKIKK